MMRRRGVGIVEVAALAHHASKKGAQQQAAGDQQAADQQTMAAQQSALDAQQAPLAPAAPAVDPQTAELRGPGQSPHAGNTATLRQIECGS
jgi:hypothetical protein